MRKEINNNYSSKTQECVQQLKEWMHSQPHLPRNYGEFGVWSAQRSQPPSVAGQRSERLWSGG